MLGTNLVAESRIGELLVPPQLEPRTDLVGERGIRLAAEGPEHERSPLLRNDMLGGVLFAFNVDHRLRIKRPFAVAIEEADGTVIARIDEINEFGCGSSTGEALEDLGKTLSELYFSLQAARDRLSPDLSSAWERLSEHIEQQRP